MKTQKNKIKPEYEWVAQQEDESIRYLQHGFPSELVRWHYHEEYELHFITDTHGKVFVGDYIGNFSPNSLILVGPNLPHNWVSEMGTDSQVKVRDLVINFTHKFIQNCERAFPEMNVIAPFWQRAQYGIEFLNSEEIQKAKDYFTEVSTSHGFRRLTRFWAMIEMLAASQDYKILSSASFHSGLDHKILKQMSKAIGFIKDNYDAHISQEEVADLVDMSTTYFSKVFKKTTGHRFVSFVNHYRVNKACELLAHSSEPVTDICFTVGFNNIANFNRQFFNLKNMTPSDYRKSALDVLYQ